jgi:hypothetical protein
VFDHEEAVKHPEGQGGNGEEVKRNCYFTMIPQKRKPMFRGIVMAVYAPQISRHRSLGYNEAQFLKFPVNARRSPRGVLGRHAFDQIAQFLADPWPTAAAAGTPPPEETKAGTVPANYRFRFHDDENIAPAGPECPEEPVQAMKRWPGPFSFENRNLLAKGEHLKSGIASAAENTRNGDDGEGEFDHEITVVAEGRPVTAPGGGTT